MHSVLVLLHHFSTCSGVGWDDSWLKSTPARHWLGARIHDHQAKRKKNHPRTLLTMKPHANTFSITPMKYYPHLFFAIQIWENGGHCTHTHTHRKKKLGSFFFTVCTENRSGGFCSRRGGGRCFFWRICDSFCTFTGICYVVKLIHIGRVQHFSPLGRGLRFLEVRH